MQILYNNKNETVIYAAEELKKYLGMMCDMNVSVQYSNDFKADDDKLIKLGLLDDFNLCDKDVHDSFIEDVIDIDINESNGYIAGSNVRSILFGVYKYLKSAGCMWVRPGIDGEYIPQKDMSMHSFKYRKKADYPFRGECCEGAISYEHMRDTVYWMPKVGMNMYMIEGLVPYMYMHKWYGHVANTKLREKGQVTDYKFLEEKIALLEKDIVKTGIQLHRLGHGWMFEKLGVHHASSNEEKNALKDEDKKYLAMVNGVRDLYGGSTFYTHFCYSNPDARKILIDFVLDYLKEKPYIDFLHLWLADASNNSCECDSCQEMLPSDWYVLLLNEIGEALEANGIKTRLVFIIYVDTLRPPKKLTLNHPEKFLLLAALGSDYERGYIRYDDVTQEQPFVLNKFQTPSNAQKHTWHRKWKKLCGNIPSCIFEYRFYLDQYTDMGYMKVAKETHRDMKALSDVDFQGNMSDQTHRCYMPTALPMLIMAETLFDKDISFEDFCDDYFSTAFGKDGDKCREYLEKLSYLSCSSNMRNNGSGHNGVEEEGILNAKEKASPWKDNPEVIEKLGKIPQLAADFMPVIEENLSDDNDCVRASWKYIKHHAEIATLLSTVLIHASKNETDIAEREYLKLQEYLCANEMDFHNVFDLFLFDRYVRMRAGLERVPYFD